MIDSREIQGQVVCREGKVVTLFSRFENGDLVGAVTDNLELDPPAAIAYAELLTAVAFEADTGLKPVGEALKAELVEKHRKRLLPVLETIIRSMVNEKYKPDKIALACVDEMCKEVF